MPESIIASVQDILSAEENLHTLYDPAVDGPRSGRYRSLAESQLHPDVKAALASRFEDGLYMHQHEAIESIQGGQNTVVATRTSSGKSLIYSLPVCDALCRDPQATALFLYPQKALANDQLLKLRQLMENIEPLADLQNSNPELVSRYDGSVPPQERKGIRENSQIVMSNPDMLHLGILNYHETNWRSFFEHLKYVVIDECHEYRGIFGTNVAYVLRRLRQICEFHGSSPQFIATSATVQDPKGHMELLTGAPFACVDADRDGSMQGRRKFWMVRGEDHYYDTGRKLGKKLADAGLTSLVFCPSRVSAERMVSRTVRPDELEASQTRVYRSGLSARQREEIENGLRTGDVKLVYSTSALELGIDIGEIDVVICVGLPHSMMSFWQRETELTRGTLVEILKQSGRLAEFKVNPQAFMTEVSKLITRTMNELVIDGIKYEKLEGQAYEMRLFEEKEIEEYLSRLYTVQSTDDRTPYDFVPFDSEVERDVAEKLDSSEAVRFFCKLPNWFKIPTPLGDYNPDWAIVLERDQKLYLVRETKDTHDRDKRRDNENKKIDCGRAHFDALGVDYEVAINIKEVLTPKRRT